MLKRKLVTLGICLASLAVAGAAAASCIPTTAAEQRARADIIFDGVALGGPTPTGIERFRVIRYRKGRGPLIVPLSTGRRRYADGTGVVTSVSITSRRGERWRIFARRIRPGLWATTVCDGSRRLR